MALLIRHRVQFRAVVRFSIFDAGWQGWRATNSGAFATAEAYREHLWSADRLEPRLHFFGELSAPLLQAMARSHDFKVLVQHSDTLPEPWISRLRELARTYPVVQLVAVPGWVEARETVAAEMERSGRNGSVVMLRLDDDDLMAADFLHQLTPHVTPSHRGWCISLGRGVTAQRGERGLVDFRMTSTPLIAIGQAFVGSYRRRGHRLDMSTLLSHRRVPETLPTVLDSRSVAWVHVRHPHQDTHVGTDHEETRRAQARALNRLSPVTDFGPLREKFPTLADSLDRAEARQRRSET